MLKVEVKDEQVSLKSEKTDIKECFYAIDTIVKAMKKNTSISNIEILELFKEICLDEETTKKEGKKKNGKK
jgi:hypothetical protein